MNNNQFLKKLQIGFSMIILTMICVFFYAVWKSNALSKKFDVTHLNITKSELKEIWGKPDEEFDLNNNKWNYMTYKDFFGHQYIFVSKKGEEIISEKYLDY